MGLFDRFKPKWKHSDPNVRMEAIKELGYDFETYSEIIKNDDDPKVIIKAIERCHEFYNPEYRDNQKLYNNLIEDINDESILLDIVYSRCYKEWEYIPCLAVKKINNESILLDIVNDNKLDTHIRRAATNKISNESLLVNIAKSDYDWYVRDGAINKIDDESVLADIVKNDKDETVRKHTIKKINNKEILLNIAINDDDEYVRKAAINKIDDESFLLDIFKKDSNWTVRKTIISKLKESDLFSEISNAQNYMDLCDESWRTREKAVEKCVDINALKHISELDPYSYPTEYDKSMDVYVSFKAPVREAAKKRLRELGY